ncbi:MAG: hypothetical protein L6Q99_17650 [Planctomycetes bacterium]|nr:hypothetical protein [Planctomycetota bacterium]
MRNVVAVCLFGLCACRATPDPAQSVRVEGAVARPGPQAWREDSTALEVLLRAEPLAGEADLAHVTLERELDGERRVLELDLRRAFERGDTTFNVFVRVGDVLHVERRTQ